MAIIRWQPRQETTWRQLDRLFNDVASRHDGLWTLAESRRWTPAIELQNADNTFVLRAELPGIEAKDLDVQVTRAAVLIAGEYRTESKTETGRLLRSEFRYGSFRRVIPLPAPVQNEQVTANFADGILTLILPKITAMQPDVVKVNLAEAAIAPAPADAAPQPETPVVETTAPATPADASTTDDVWAEAAA